MDAIVITWQQLLYLTMLVVLVYGLEMLFFLRKTKSTKPSQDIAPLLERLTLLEVRMQALESLEERGQVPQLAVDAESPYSHAIKLAEEGYDVASIASESGISRGEAELIVALYRSGGTR